MSIYNVIDRIWDTRNFNVGGGAASAVAGSMAAGLVGMVARLSMGKEYGLSNDEYQKIVNEMECLCKDLREGAQADEIAFLKIRKAFSLPKTSNEEKAFRAKAIESAAIDAAKVPLENGNKSALILKYCILMKGRSNPSAFSDLEVGRMLALAAIRGCVLNVEANLPLIKSPKKIDSLKQELKQLKVVLTQEII